MTSNLEILYTKRINTIFFDLDATLVPYVQAELTDAYFGDLHKFAAEKLGCSAAARFDDAAMKGFRAMKQNDGSMPNIQLFRNVFYQEWKDFPFDVEAFYEEFYNGPFDAVKRVVHFRGSEKSLLHNLHKKGYKLVCATNPVFPLSANRRRMAWAGIAPEDFDYITNFDNCHYCKPSAGYFKEAAAAVGSPPELCLMVGNDTVDDMGALDAGMQVILITDYLHVRGGRSLDQAGAMDYASFLQFAQMLPAVD